VPNIRSRCAHGALTYFACAFRAHERDMVPIIKTMTKNVIKLVSPPVKVSGEGASKVESDSGSGVDGVGVVEGGRGKRARVPAGAVDAAVDKEEEEEEEAEDQEDEEEEQEEEEEVEGTDHDDVVNLVEEMPLQPDPYAFHGDDARQQAGPPYLVLTSVECCGVWCVAD